MALNDSFTDALEKIKEVLPVDPDVSAFCQEKYGRPLTVELVLRSVKQISPDECPIIMITRPTWEPKNEPGMTAKILHDVLLYGMIYQMDKGKAVLEIIQFEELIDEALQRNANLGGLVADIIPAGTGTDEGVFNPKYAFVKAVKVIKHVNQLMR